MKIKISYKHVKKKKIQRHIVEHALYNLAKYSNRKIEIKKKTRNESEPDFINPIYYTVLKSCIKRPVITVEYRMSAIRLRLLID